MVQNRNNNIEGNIPVYGSSQNPLFFTNEFNREGKTCKISKTPHIPRIMLMNEKYFLKDGSFTIESNNQTLLTNESTVALTAILGILSAPIDPDSVNV